MLCVLKDWVPWKLVKNWDQTVFVGFCGEQDLASAGRGGRVELRWANIVGPGTWPEILRRYALTRRGAHPFYTQTLHA